MPRGVYTFSSGRVEAFSCAPGPAGWRYVSGDLDLACDRAFRPVRYAIGQRTGWSGRLDDGTGVLYWPAPDGLQRASCASVLLTPSAGSWVSAIRQVALPGADQADGTLAALVVEQAVELADVHELQFARTGATVEAADLGDLLVEAWQLTDHTTCSTGEAHIAGDVLIYARLPDRGELEITELESPPNFRAGVPTDRPL